MDDGAIEVELLSRIMGNLFHLMGRHWLISLVINTRNFATVLQWPHYAKKIDDGSTPIVRVRRRLKRSASE